MEKKGKRIESIEDELPQVIIQHIQSFLRPKEAVLSSVLSKSWYNSWLTRPTLDFDERDFIECCPEAEFNDEFGNFVKRSIYRYNELNLQIVNFHLLMNVRDSDSSHLANELILGALKVGVGSFNVEIHPPISKFLLPKEVLEAESLVGLSAFGCQIGGVLGVKVGCSKIKSLQLRNVCLRAGVVQDIFSNCTLIEDLYMLDCDGLRKVNVSKLVNLKQMVIKQLHQQPMGVDSFVIEVDVVTTPVFSKMSCLVLVGVRIDPKFFHDFAVRFPSLEDLTVQDCSGCKKIAISSNSLKYISLHFGKKLEAQIDAPSIRKFKYTGATIPLLSFMPATREWESDIGLTSFSACLSVSWLLELNQFLTSLSMSKISLRISFYGYKVDHVVDNIKAYPKPVVDNLMLTTSTTHYLSPATCSAVWEGLLWSFSPKIVSVGHEDEYWQRIGKKLIQQCSKTEELFHIQDLGGVYLEYYNKILREWQPMSAKHLVDPTTFPKDGRKYRFLLRWKKLGLEDIDGQVI